MGRDVARELSNDKREAILEAAAHWVAAEGPSARTLRIAATAKVAEGTIFKYFATKDVLLNALYVALKADLFGALIAAFESREDDKGRWQAVWTAFVDWGVGNAIKRRALRQLQVSETITAESRRIALGAAEQAMAALLPEEGRVGGTQPRGFVAAVFDALAEMTIDLIAADPAAHEELRQRGFESFWRAIGRA